MRKAIVGDVGKEFLIYLQKLIQKHVPVWQCLLQ